MQKTVNIKGKDYVLVNWRIDQFRQMHPDWCLESELVSFDDASCIVKATVKDETGRVIATGHAVEDKNDGYINKTSFIENCETSAWGRALACLGIGLDASVSSAEEVQIAIEKEEEIKSRESASNSLPNADKVKNSEILAYITQELPSIGNMMRRSEKHTYMNAEEYETAVKEYLLGHIHKKINPLYDASVDTVEAYVKHIKAEDPKYQVKYND